MVTDTDWLAYQMIPDTSAIVRIRTDMIWTYSCGSGCRATRCSNGRAEAVIWHPTKVSDLDAGLSIEAMLIETEYALHFNRPYWEADGIHS